jgi:hypothetical protein
MKTIEILVSPQGATTVQTKGFSGSSCREGTRFLEEALGRQIGERLTAEFHQASCTEQDTERLSQGRA